eukprot:COSAG01_NODE_13094_length_1636_cov_4.320104_3_plen_209_part_00
MRLPRAGHGLPSSCCRGASPPRRGPCVQARRFDVMRDGGERLSLQQHNGAAVVGHSLAHESGGGESDARRHQQASEIEHRRRVEDTVVMLAAGQAAAARRKARWSRSPRKEAPEPYPPSRCRVRRCHQGEAPRIRRGATLLSFALACDTPALCCAGRAWPVCVYGWRAGGAVSPNELSEAGRAFALCADTGFSCAWWWGSTATWRGCN